MQYPMVGGVDLAGKVAESRSPTFKVRERDLGWMRERSHNVCYPLRRATPSS